MNHGDKVGNVCLPEYICVGHFVLPSCMKDVVEVCKVEVINLVFMSRYEVQVSESRTVLVRTAFW